MPRSFLFTNRRYIPTPPPDAVVADDDNNTIISNAEQNTITSNADNHQDPRSVTMDRFSSSGQSHEPVSPNRLSSEMIVAQILIGQAEQTEAVDLALHKPARLDSPTTNYHHHSTSVGPTIVNHITTPVTTTNSNNIVIMEGAKVEEYSCDNGRSNLYLSPVSNTVMDSGSGSGSDSRYYAIPDSGSGSGSDSRYYAIPDSGSGSGSDSRYYAIPDSGAVRPSVIYSSVNNNNSNNYISNSNNNYSSNVDVISSNEVGMDLSLKVADHRSQAPAPGPAPSSAPSTVTAPCTMTAPGSPDKSSHSDADSDSGCSSQNEARGHLPPEVEYGWADCHAHFSLLYDLMTQGGRKVTAVKEKDGPVYTAKEAASEQAPYDYSLTPTRDAAQEPPVLYELMTESPRKASGRDVPEHAMEVEVSMQQYPSHPGHPNHADHHQHHHTPQYQQVQHQPHQQQYQHPQQVVPVPARPPSNEYRRATLQEVAHDRGHINVSNNVAPPPPRYEPRRSLNDLLFAAGLPPVSPPSPTPSACSLSSQAGCGEENHACEECGKRYSTSSNLARHRQTHRSHGDKKARKCPHCDKVYVSMPAFSMHVRTHNQGCGCPHCGKRFSRPWLLQGHIRTHTGEKPFACPQCAKSFADKSNLRAHVQTHSSEKPYVCGRCGKAFALKSYLYKHEESSCMRGERFRPLRRQVSAEC